MSKLKNELQKLKVMLDQMCPPIEKKDEYVLLKKRCTPGCNYYQFAPAGSRHVAFHRSTS